MTNFLNLNLIFSFQLHHGSLDDEIQTQSRDSEAPPPHPILPRGPHTDVRGPQSDSVPSQAPIGASRQRGSDSYTNLFDMSQDMPLGVSAHSMRSGSNNNIAARQGNNHVNNQNHNHNRAGKVSSPGRQRATKMAGIHQQQGTAPPPMAQPDQFSPMSTPSPTGGINSGHITTQAPLLAADQKYPTTQALIADRSAGHHKPPLPTPTHQGNNAKRWGGDAAAPPPVAPRQHPPSAYSNPPGHVPTTGNTAVVHKPPQHYQPKTAGSHTQGGGPQGYGGHNARAPVHRYKDSGFPGGNHTSATQQQIDDVPGAIRRPMSFVKALEMSDALAMEEKIQRQRQQNHQPPSHAPRTQGSTVSGAQTLPPTNHQQQQRPGGTTQASRAKDGKQYGSTYEISV